MFYLEHNALLMLLSQCSHNIPPKNKNSLLRLFCEHQSFNDIQTVVQTYNETIDSSSIYIQENRIV